MECPICRSINPPEFKFCGRCGSEISQSSGSEEKPSEHKSERKYVTVLFSDLSGYTAMTERLDPEEVRAILNKVFKIISNIIEKFDGFIERYIGDSIMAVFGIPKAHEDNPSRAVHAAFTIHAAIKSMNPWIREKTGLPVFMHTGINTGLVVTGEVNAETGSHGLTGLTVNIASRLEGLSKDDEILVGPETHKLTEHLFDFQALKPVQVKGKSELLPVYKALSKKQKTFPEPPKTSFSGRTEELALLTELSDQLLRTGSGHIVFIIGDPGIGKSRLVEEYKKQLSHDGLLWLEGRSSSYLQETSYGTFLNILKKYAGIKDADDDINGWNKLEEKLTRLFPEEVPDTLPYLATLLSLKVKGNLLNKVLFLDGEAFKNQIFRAFYLFLKRLTEDRPVVLEFEDYHWADQSTVDLLGHLLSMVCDVPLLLLLVSRDTENLPAAETRTLLQSEYSDHYSEIILEPLSVENIINLAFKNLNLDPIFPPLNECFSSMVPSKAKSDDIPIIQAKPRDEKNKTELIAASSKSKRSIFESRYNTNTPRLVFSLPLLPLILPLRGISSVYRFCRRAYIKIFGFHRSEGDHQDSLDCTLYAPSEAKNGGSLLVQVYAHLITKADEAQAMAHEFDSSSSRRGFTSLGTKIAKGATLTFELILPGLVVEPPLQNLVWLGRTNYVQYSVFIPTDHPPSDIVGKLLVSQESIPIGQIIFKIRVVSAGAYSDPSPKPTGSATRYSLAFISYASIDRPEVLRRVQMLPAVGIRYFQDVLSLDPGDRWEKKLFHHIDDSDVMFLFWSSAAKESEWVTKEWQYGLERKGDSYIRPIVIEGPPHPNPPHQLKHLHFADKMLYFIKGTDM